MEMIQGRWARFSGRLAFWRETSKLCSNNSNTSNNKQTLKRIVVDDYMCLVAVLVCYGKHVTFLTWIIPLCLFSSFAPRKRAAIKRYTTYPFINSGTQF